LVFRYSFGAIVHQSVFWAIVTGSEGPWERCNCGPKVLLGDLGRLRRKSNRVVEHNMLVHQLNRCDWDGGCFGGIKETICVWFWNDSMMVHVV
jgi:hypothetical protein